MNIFRWLLAKISILFFASRTEQKRERMIRQKDSGNYTVETYEKIGNFDDDYRSATYMLKLRMNKKFPDNYHARLSSGKNSPYDHGEERALAVDTASIAIAMALRNGASVREAAEGGAASVGI